MENIKLTMWICIGAPGSGKSTFSKKMVDSSSKNIIRVCPDDNRRIIGGDSNNQLVSGQAFSMAKNQITNALKNNCNVIFDATNMSKRDRKPFIDLANVFGAKTVALVFECNKETLLDRNKKRGLVGGRNVAENIIDHFLKKYQKPDLIEFDDVKFITKI